jgi:hypothetical protein
MRLLSHPTPCKNTNKVRTNRLKIRENLEEHKRSLEILIDSQIFCLFALFFYLTLSRNFRFGWRDDAIQRAQDYLDRRFAGLDGFTSPRNQLQYWRRGIIRELPLSLSLSLSLVS